MSATETIPSIHAPEERPHTWSLELLYEMDWRRFRELTCSFLLHQGFNASVLGSLPDGGIAYRLSPVQKPRKTASILFCPTWRDPEVNLPLTETLLQMVRDAGAAKGIFITPGHVTLEARRFAEGKPLELIDGWAFLDWIQDLPAEDQAHYLRVATVGSYRVPACPGCGSRMQMDFTDQPPRSLADAMGNLVLRENRFITLPVRCRHLVVRPGVHVHFRKGVVAEDVQIFGDVSGEILCTGRVHLAEGARLSGALAAKSIRLDSGADLDADARVLSDAEWAPEAIAGHWFTEKLRVWRCASYRPCDVVLEAR